MKKVLVTGASGFIGGRLVESLVKKDRQVRCLVRKTSRVDELEKLGVELVYGALSDENAVAQAVSGVDVVYHVAGLTCALTFDELNRANALGAGNVASACAAQSQPPVLVLVSSVSAAGPTSRGQVRNETHPANPISEYGRSKRNGELAVEKWAASTPTTIVRPGIVFGPHDRLTLPMFKTIRQFRFHPLPGFNTPQLSFVVIDDLIEILLRAAENGSRVSPNGANGTASSGYYFACDDEHLDYAQLGRLVRPMLRRPYAVIFPLVPPVPGIAARVSELAAQLRGRPSIFNLDKVREASAASWACSPKVAQRDLGFLPPKPLAERFRETIEWYFDHGWL